MDVYHLARSLPLSQNSHFSFWPRWGRCSWSFASCCSVKGGCRQSVGTGRVGTSRASEPQSLRASEHLRAQHGEASAPPFLLSLFLLSNACAFIYLLLAVWLSMHARALDLRALAKRFRSATLASVWQSHGFQASIASHSFGVRLWAAQSWLKARLCASARLTRFVRLPIPSMKQIAGLRRVSPFSRVSTLAYQWRSTLKDYERQGVANLLRLPFQDGQFWSLFLKHHFLVGSAGVAAGG